MGDTSADVENYCLSDVLNEEILISVGLLPLSPVSALPSRDVARLAERIMEEDPPLARVLPGLATREAGTVDISEMELPIRAYNGLRRSGAESLADVLDLRPRDLSRVKNLGRKSVIETLVRLVEMATDPKAVPTRTITTANAASTSDGVRGKTAISPYPALADWVRYRGITTFAGLLGDLSGPRWLPSAVEREAAHLLQGHPAFLIGSSAESSLGDQVVGLLKAIGEDRSKRLWLRRAIGTPKPTLETLSDEEGVTRERIRQLVDKGRQEIEALLATDAHFRFAGWLVGEIASFASPLAPSSAVDEGPMAFLCNIADGVMRARTRATLLALADIREKDGWAYSEGGQDLLPTNPAVLTQFVRDDLSVGSRDEFASVLQDRGVAPDWIDAWVEACPTLRGIDNTLVMWSGSLASKAATVLAVRGAPMTNEDLLAAVTEGHNERGALTQFGKSDRLTRVGRDTWALAEWGMPEYESIAMALRGEIEERGGCVSLSRIEADLAERFNVAPGSVRIVACNAPLFVAEPGGLIRLRRPDEPFEFDSCSHETPFLYQGDEPDVLLWRVAVDSDTLRGSGRRLPVALASHLAISPGEQRLVPGEQRVRVSWPTTSSSGPAVGSLREVARALGGEEGGFLWLAFDRERLIGAQAIAPMAPSADSEDILRSLLCIDSSASLLQTAATRLFVASDNVDVSIIRNRLRQRREDDLLDALRRYQGLPQTSGVRGATRLVNALEEALPEHQR